MTNGATPMMSPREVILALLAQDQTRAELAADPSGTLAEHGYPGFTRDDVTELVRAVGDSVPTGAAMALDGFGTPDWDPTDPFPLPDGSPPHDPDGLGHLLEHDRLLGVEVVDGDADDAATEIDRPDDDHDTDQQHGSQADGFDGDEALDDELDEVASDDLSIVDLDKLRGPDLLGVDDDPVGDDPGDGGLTDLDLW